MRNYWTVLLLLVSTISYAQQAQKTQATAAEIDAVFSQWNTPDKAGIAVGIVSDGKTIYTKGYGLANMEHNIPIVPSTKFYVGDIAKEFTVYSILLLEERGKLSMKDDVRRILPQLENHARPVTIEQLIYHTSGLNNHMVSKTLSGWAPEDILSKNQAYTMIENQANYNHDGGSTQSPTDFGFMILEDVVSQVSGKSYTDFVTDEIFRPLGMDNSVFDNYGAVLDNKAQGYINMSGNYRVSHFNPEHTLVSDLYTTVEDMCLWALELSEPKVGTAGMVSRYDNLSVVNGETVDKSNMALYTGGHRYWDFMGTNKLYHIEVSGGYACKLIRYPDYDLAVVVLGNDGIYNGYACTGASELYIKEFLESPQSTATAEINSKTLSRAELLSFEGVFWDNDNHTSRNIHMDNDTLWYVRNPRNRSALIPTSDHSFKMITRGDVEVSFNKNVSPMTMQVRVGEELFDMVSYDEKASWTSNLTPFTGTYYSKTLDVTYKISINNKLTISHPRMDPVKLDPRIKDLFAGDQEFFESIQFKRNENGQVTGLVLSTGGIADVWFEKKPSTSL